MPPQPADQFFDAGQRLTAALVDDAHHPFAFARHHAQKGFGIELAAMFLEHVTERAFVIEADQFVEVFFFGQCDLLIGERLAKGLKVQRLAVDDDTVEIEENCRGPIGHRG